MKWMKSPRKDQKINKSEGKEPGQERALVASLLWFHFWGKKTKDHSHQLAQGHQEAHIHPVFLQLPFQQRVTNRTFHNFFPIAFPILRTLIPSWSLQLCLLEMTKGKENEEKLQILERYLRKLAVLQGVGGACTEGLQENHRLSSHLSPRPKAAITVWR